MRKKLVIILAGTVAALTLGSIAWAAIPDGNGVINGCYDKATGALRVTDTATHTPKACTNKEAALTWNQQGPKGDPGLPGPKGDKGDKGDPGPSHAYWTVGGNLITSTTDYGSKVAELTVPPTCPFCFNYPGDDYMFSAKAVVVAKGPNVAPEIVYCKLQVSAGNNVAVDFAEGTVSSNASGNVLVSTLSMQATEKLNGGTAAVFCYAPQLAEAWDVKISAVQVGAVN